jgi:hypothetical protein
LKEGRKLLKRIFALVAGKQKLTAYLICIKSPHLLTRRKKSPESIYTEPLAKFTIWGDLSAGDRQL